jgi:hypothetical protein
VGHAGTAGEGVTGAFIKELMRQATLRAALDDRAPSAADVKMAGLNQAL